MWLIPTGKNLFRPAWALPRTLTGNLTTLPGCLLVVGERTPLLLGRGHPPLEGFDVSFSVDCPVPPSKVARRVIPVTTLGKLFTYVPRSPNSIIIFSTVQKAVEPIAGKVTVSQHCIMMSHWPCVETSVVHQSLRKGNKHPVYTPHMGYGTSFKRHIDRFIRFGTTRGRDQQVDTQHRQTTLL